MRIIEFIAPPDGWDDWDDWVAYLVSDPVWEPEYTDWPRERIKRAIVINNFWGIAPEDVDGNKIDEKTIKIIKKAFARVPDSWNPWDVAVINMNGDVVYIDFINYFIIIAKDKETNEVFEVYRCGNCGGIHAVFVDVDSGEIIDPYGFH